jgi:hypothetical protein
LSTAAQNVDVGHETEVNQKPASMALGEDHDVPLYVRAFPFLSTATQKATDGHDTETIPDPASMTFGEDHVAPFLKRTSLLRSTAAQKISLGHEIPKRLPFETTPTPEDVLPLYTNAWPELLPPLPPTMLQDSAPDEGGQDTPKRLPFELISPGPDHAVPLIVKAKPIDETAMQ